MHRVRVFMIVVLVLGSQATHALDPLRLITETFSEWKERLFGSNSPAVVDAPPHGPILVSPAHPQRFTITPDTSLRDFSRGRSRFRLVELPRELDHAAVRIQIIAQRNRKGRGNTVFKPVLYALNSDDAVRDPVEVKPLHLDIRPFRRTRLLGCVPLENLQRFAVATAPDIVGTYYKSEVREAVKAPTRGGFYYATDAVKMRLPYVDTGVLILDVIETGAKGEGC